MDSNIILDMLELYLPIIESGAVKSSPFSLSIRILFHSELKKAIHLYYFSPVFSYDLTDPISGNMRYPTRVFPSAGPTQSCLGRQAKLWGTTRHVDLPTHHRNDAEPSSGSRKQPRVDYRRPEKIFLPGKKF